MKIVLKKIVLNEPLPAFFLPSVQKNGEETVLNNAAFSRRAFVLFFYPKDATCGCTIEVCGFRDLYGEFQKAGIEVLGVSRDTLGAHRRFIAAQELPFPLLSDKGGELMKNWGLIVDAKMYGKPVTKVARTTVLVDELGVVRQIWENVTPLGHAAQVLQWAQSHKA